MQRRLFGLNFEDSYKNKDTVFMFFIARINNIA